jgi:hypothetical protein
LVVPILLLGGCTGEETIPLKKVDYVIEIKEPPKGSRTMKGASSKMQRDPSGMHPGQ